MPQTWQQTRNESDRLRRIASAWRQMARVEAAIARDLMHGVGDWPWTPPPPRERPVAPMPPAHCETAFRSWFDGLCAECKAVDP